MLNFVIFFAGFGIGYFIAKTNKKEYAPSSAGDINKFSFETPDKSPRSSSRMQ